MNVLRRLKNLWRLSNFEFGINDSTQKVLKDFAARMEQKKMATIVEDDKPELFPEHEEEIQ